MEDWTSGYVADIGYTYGYFFELNPLRTRLPLLYQGIEVPEYATACELGFGQGISTNLHAAASQMKWYGTDFNPTQAGFAQQLAKHAGSSAELFDESFSEFCNRDDLPGFDFIGLHGIWSWVSDENRRILVDFIKRKLNVGGVLYISYNTLPGWSEFAPVRHILTQHADIVGSTGEGIVSRIGKSLDFVEQLIETDPLYSKLNPNVKEKLAQVKTQNSHYLAHEYFNKDWHPMHFSTMADWLSSAKVEFACSAVYLNHIDVVSITETQRELLGTLPNKVLEQTVRDFMTNQQFRRDYWIKGVRRLSPLERFEALRDEKVVLLYHREDVPLMAKGSLGEATLTPAIYDPILDVLSDYKVKTLGQIHEKLADHNIDFPQLLEAIIILADSGRVSSAYNSQQITKIKKQTDRLNAYIIDRARGSSDITNLACPVTGGAIPVDRFEQIFVASIQQNNSEPMDWAHSVWAILNMQKQKVVKEGKTLESDEENIQELLRRANEFQSKKLPILKAMQIV
ncbi:MAG: methyltransferase [Pseudohongiella sp.]|nr:MAG: methyltransferase [Pseudohongiella sp.]